MIDECDIRIGLPHDAVEIAQMSRDFIEPGLGWQWTPIQVTRSIRDKNTNVAVAFKGDVLCGFCITKYREIEAHILLLAVGKTFRRKGVGRALIEWIEATALTAGIGVIYLETRLAYGNARKFYAALGYKEIKLEPKMYRGKEAGVCLAKDLWHV